jgi:hypothetical protein
VGLSTGTPLGSVTTNENIFVEGAPWIYFQDATANWLNNPDAQGYYWGLSGTTTYPVYTMGCVTNVKLSEKVTMNDVRCDNVGVKDTIQKRDYIELDVTILTPFPLSQLSAMLNLSAATVGTGYEKVGIGMINNAQYWRVYAPKVFDEAAGDLLMFNLNRVKFVDAWSIDFKYGAPWEITGIKMRAFVDDTKPSTQYFGAIFRSDKSALP